MQSTDYPGLVLIVDGDQAVQGLVATIFKLWLNARVVAAIDGEQALVLARELKPDLVILATRLRKVNGFEVARQLKDDPLTRGIPLVALTSEPRHAVLAVGFDDYLFRPFGVRQFIRTVSAYLGDRPESGGTAGVTDRPTPRSGPAGQNEAWRAPRIGAPTPMRGRGLCRKGETGRDRGP